MTHITEEEAAAMGLPGGPAKPKRQKYRNKPCMIDGLRFDSHAEGRRYAELRLLQQAGEISELEADKKHLHYPIPGGDGGKAVAYYEADFRYFQHGHWVIEDVKSPATARNPVYRLKLKLVLSYFKHQNLEHREVVM